MNSILFFTCATGIYKSFVIPYIYFAIKSNPNAKFEIIVEDGAEFEEVHYQSLKKLRSENEILIRGIPDSTIKPKMDNSIRFIVEPLLRADYVYIGDVDILIVDNILPIHMHVFDYGLPYSNLIRANTKKLTGLHLATYDSQYPLPYIEDLISTYSNDEELLFAIMDRKRQIYEENIYKNIVKIRPIHGLHMSLNRLPFFDHKLRVGWGITYDVSNKIFNICQNNEFESFLEVCDSSARLIFCNALILTSGINSMGVDSFNKISKQFSKTDSTNNLIEYGLTEHKNIFSKIFKNNSWKNSESFSGPSSTIERTEHIRSELPKLIKLLSVSSILDAPCGDLTWMSYLLKNNVFSNYIGADVVPELIDLNIQKYGTIKNVNFLTLDITKDILPDADIMLCRNCLFHFSYVDFYKFIQNFLNSNIKYLLTTSHINNSKFKNSDIATGGWKWMDLFLEPYSFPVPIYKFNDGTDRELCLWTRDQVSNLKLN